MMNIRTRLAKLYQHVGTNQNKLCNQSPIRTTVVGSYPFPGWLEFAVKNLNEFGNADREELIESMTLSSQPFTIR
jgi:hypothetical protein